MEKLKKLFTIRDRIRFHVITLNLASSLLALTTYHNVTHIHVFGFKWLIPREEQLPEYQAND